jgi:GT2 family glycosyltransferase
MPSRDPGRFGRIAVESVLRELGPADEVIIQDANSTDGWLKELPADPRVHVVSERDNGQADALNRALGRASGEWILWLNADDIVFPGSLRATEQLNAYDVIYGGFATIDASGDVIRRFFPDRITFDRLILRGCLLFSGSTLFRRDALISIGGFRSDYHYCMDYELFLRAFSSDLAVTRSPHLIGALRIHPDTKTSGVPWEFVKEAARARSEYTTTRRLHLYAAVQRLEHALLVASTPVRASSLYLRLRRRGDPPDTADLAL